MELAEGYQLKGISPRAYEHPADRAATAALKAIPYVDAETVKQALDVAEIACVQNGYSVLDRSHEDVLELCCERDMAFVPFFPLGSAWTGGPATLAADPAVARVAQKHSATPSQVALAWLLHRDEHILLIPGTSSVAHLEENLAAGDLQLDREDLETLEQVRQVGDPVKAVAERR